MSRAFRIAFLLLVAQSLAAVPAAAQRSPSVPPPTPVPPLGSPSPYPTALDTPSPSTEPPKVDAAAAALADLDSGRILFESGTDEPLPIASLTKVMTALIVIEHTEPTELVTTSPEAASQTGAELGLQPEEQLSVHHLLIALLLQSANDAAVALAEHVAGSSDAFVELMNAKAQELGMKDTEFRSPSGLDDSGHSSARDLLTLSSEAFLDPTFAGLVGTELARVPAENGEARSLQNRNALLWLYEGTIGGKTGYTAAAGFCLIAAAERDGLRLAAVVLGVEDQAFDEGAVLLDHGFASWERETVVALGEEVDPISVDGEPVPAEASSTLSVVVPKGSVVDTDVRELTTLRLPVDEGEPLGSLIASRDGKRLGRVELIAAEQVEDTREEETSDAPFLEQVWDAVSGLFGRLYEVLAG
ncbi:MAG: D-alanyl-D-alanine carboxypeptidase family protein [Actinomycetota bacterium]